MLLLLFVLCLVGLCPFVGILRIVKEHSARSVQLCSVYDVLGLDQIYVGHMDFLL